MNSNKEIFKNPNTPLLIKTFMDEAVTDSEINLFFNTLHRYETTKLISKSFKLDVENIGTMWGIFYFNNKYGYEDQYIKISTFGNHTNRIYAKSQQLLHYLHEATHEKQRDFYIYHNENGILETTEYNKLLNLENFCTSDAKKSKATYEQLLVEIDAISNSITQYKYLLDNNIVPVRPETMIVLLYACVRYIASINCEKHLAYYPKNFTLKSDKLIEYYKNFYSEQFANNNLEHFIEYSDIDYAKKRQELKNIDFDKVALEINKKTVAVCDIFQDVYAKFMKQYKFSPNVLNKLEVNNADEVLTKHNKITVAATIFMDLHKEYQKTLKERVL